MSAAREQAGGRSCSDKLYLLTSSDPEEKSFDDKPGRDNLEEDETKLSVAGMDSPRGAGSGRICDSGGETMMG